MNTEDIRISDLTAVELIKLLDTAYPPACIGPTQDLTSAHRYAGKRELVEELMAALNEEEADDPAL